MPLFSKKHVVPDAVDPVDWRPQVFSRGMRKLPTAIVEPAWRGVRVLAWVTPAGARFVDEDGTDCSAEFAPVGRELAAAADASEMILDGYLTVEATQETAGLGDPGMNVPTGGQVMAQMLFGGRVLGNGVRGEPERKMDLERPVAFVAVDLLSIDGVSLLDAPLLERKRLLDGALRPGEAVRITPFVQAPVGPYAMTWRNLGFTELAYKGANSRYAPGIRNDDWFIAPMPLR
jgi:ATP-dependent DNA ligase